jgi:hypothetical protein
MTAGVAMRSDPPERISDHHGHAEMDPPAPSMSPEPSPLLALACEACGRPLGDHQLFESTGERDSDLVRADLTLTFRASLQDPARRHSRTLAHTGTPSLDTR